MRRSDTKTPGYRSRFETHCWQSIGQVPGALVELARPDPGKLRRIQVVGAA
jgi:hypothetical protein